MNDYTGKICPYCKTAFKPDDAVNVICHTTRIAGLKIRAVQPLVASEQSRRLAMTTVRLQPKK